MIDTFLNDCNSICISGHISPDGDCAGSVLALYSYIRKKYPEKEADIYLEPVSDKLSFLSHFDRIDHACEKKKDYDLMICLDAASIDRLGKAEKYFHTAGKTVNIDHHISNTRYAETNIVEPEASSACEVLYGLLDPAAIDRDIAICLYTGIIFDTGVFKYSCTSPKTMEIAAQLMHFDIPVQKIIDDSFYAKTYNENRIYGYAVMKSMLAFDDKVIYSFVTKEKMKLFHVTKMELEGIVSQMLLTKGVECSIFIYDLDEQTCKVSLRSSSYVNVNEIAQKFGGGGHQRAAGFLFHGSAGECIPKILEEVGKVI